MPFFRRKLKTKDLMFFSRQLTAMIGAGITVVESLKLLKEQEPHHLLSKGIERVQKKVEEGYTLADALRFQGFLFPKIFVNLVEAGELAGKLDDILSKLAEHYEKQYSLEQKIKSASFLSQVYFNSANFCCFVYGNDRASEFCRDL